MNILNFLLLVTVIVLLLKLMSRLHNLENKNDAWTASIIQRIYTMEKRLTNTQQPPAETPKKPDNAAAVECTAAEAPEPPPAEALTGKKEETQSEEFVMPEPKAAVIPEVKIELTQKPKEEERKVLPAEKHVDADSFEARTNNAIEKMTAWLCVDEGYRIKGISGEYAIATTWLIRAGILILLFGIGFFVKYAHDHALLLPGIRILLAVLTGAVMSTAGWKLSKEGKYRPLWIAVLGAGFVVLYLSFFAAYGLYHLFGAGTTFAAMAAVTVAAMTAAVRRDAILTAVIGCIGGFLTPIAIHTGTMNLTGLLAYFAMLCGGILAVKYFRNWLILNILSFSLYASLSMGAVLSASPTDMPHGHLLPLLITISYLIFAAFALAGKKRRHTETVLDQLLYLANIIVYFLLISIYAETAGSIRQLMTGASLLTALVSAGEFALMRYLDRDNRLAQGFLLTAAAFSLCVMIPFLLKEVWISVAGAALAGVMVYLGAKTKTRLLFLLGAIISVLTCFYAVSYYAWWTAENSHQAYTVLLLKRLLLFLPPILMYLEFSAVFHCCRKTCPNNNSLNYDSISVLTAVLAGIGLFLLSSNEVFYSINAYMPEFRHGALSIWWGGIALALLFFGIMKHCKALRMTGICLFFICTCKIFSIDLANLHQLYKIAAFILTGLLFLGGAAVYIRFKDFFLDSPDKK